MEGFSFNYLYEKSGCYGVIKRMINCMLLQREKYLGSYK
jgi:hypothetical protein